MKKTIFISFYFVWLLASCAGTATELPASDEGVSSPSPRNNALSPDAQEEVIDTECSYFYFLWGKTAEVENRLDEAVEAYEKAIVCDESADHIIKRLVVLLARLDKKQEAMAWVAKVVAKQPGDVSAKMLQANLYAAIGDIEQSKKAYQAILAQDPDNSEAMLMLASLFINTSDLPKGLEYLERLVKVDVDSDIGYQYLAKLYWEMGDAEKAMAAYQRALATNWQTSLAMEAAALYEEQGKIEEAAALYQKIISYDYANETAAGRLASLYLKNGKGEESLAVLRELRRITLDPKRVELSIGRVLVELKRYDEAIDLFQEMMTRYPDFELVSSILALTYYEKGEKQKAKELLLKIPKEKEGYRDALVILVNILRDEKDFAAAIQLLHDLLQSEEPNGDFTVYAILADLYRDNQEMDKAIALFKQAIVDFPNEPDLHYRYGMFLEGAGQRQEAMIHILRVLELDAENPFALNYVGYTWADEGKNLDQALIYIQKAISLRPDDGFIRDSLGWVYYKSGAIDKAIAELGKAVAAVPDDPTVLEHFADALVGDNQRERALEHYRKSVLLFQDEKDIDRLRAKIEALQ